MGKPCLFFKVNRVLDWEPVGFFSSDVHSFFTGASADQTLAEDSFCASKSEWCDQERSKSRMNSFLQSVVPVDQNPVVRCMQYSDSTDVRTKFIFIIIIIIFIKKVPLKYFPSDGAIGWQEPFTGQSYQSPLVAVQS